MSLTLVAITRRSIGRPMQQRDIAGIDVAEIAGRHREGDLAMRRAERNRGGEIVDHLRDDARPVDRIDARESRLVAESVVVEHALHDRLAIIEGALDRQCVDIVVAGRRHHPPLHVGDAALRKQHEEIGAGAASERLDRGSAGIARRRDHDGGALPARGERMVHQAAKELHGQVLERERGPVKQLQYEIARPELHERRDRGMAEIAVGLARHAAEIVLGDGIADEGADHLDRHLRIGPAGEARDGVGLEPRPSRRHVEAAVAREPCEHRLDEAKRWGLTPGGNITHGRGAPIRGYAAHCAGLSSPCGKTA